MKRDTKRNIFVIAILLVLLFGCISTSNFSHADSGFDTGYSGGGGYSGGSYSDSSDYDFSGGSGGIHLLAFIVMAIILIIREIYRSIERSQIKSGLEKQKELDKKYDGLSDEDIWKIDKTLSLEILTLTAKSAYEKYAKNINKQNRLQSILDSRRSQHLPYHPAR